MPDHDSASEFVRHVPCPACGSSDANSEYSDGHTHCFSCGVTVQAAGAAAPARETTAASMEPFLLPVGEYRALPKRRITEETCRKYGYSFGTYRERPVQIANYRKDGKLVAQKVRFADKTFKFLGDTKESGLFGQHLWAGDKKRLCITEGEIDCLSMAQVLGLRWPVVSVPSGAQGAAKSIRREIEWVSSFDSVIIMFDMDDPGREAAMEVAALLPPGKAYIAALPRKDPNEMLVAGEAKALVDCFWQAQAWRPDGIVSGVDLWSEVNRELAASTPYPWPSLTEMTYGIRKGELTTFTAGSGIGKSSIVRAIVNHLHAGGATIGMVMLEESVRKTALLLMGEHAGRPLHLDQTGIDEETMRAAFDATVGSGRMWLYDHFGSLDGDNLLSKLRYLATQCGCDYLVLDHISIAISGIETDDERRAIDILMTKLRSLVEETGVGLIMVSHLKRPDGKGHEEGAVTSLAQLRGSAAIAQLSDMVIGAERNQQDPQLSHLTTMRVLKNRFSGDTGVACHLSYDRETGRLTEVDPEEVSPFDVLKEEF